MCSPTSAENSAALSANNSRNQVERNINMQLELFEQWKPVKGYEGLYEVSNFGKVKSIKRGSILKQFLRKDKRSKIILCKNGKVKCFSVHKLIWNSFSNDKELLKKEIDHIDNNPLNNRIENLQSLTTRENTTKYFLTIKKSSKYVGVYFNKNAKKWMARILLDRKRLFLGYFSSEDEAANSYYNKLKEFNEHLEL